MNSPNQRTCKLSNYVCVPLDIPLPSHLPHLPHLPEPTCHPCSFSLAQVPCLGAFTDPVAHLPTLPLSVTNPLRQAPLRTWRVTKPYKNCQQALVQPKHAVPSSSPPPEMPSELVDLIFSFLPLSALPVTMQTCKLFHAIAERQLYFTVHCIDFFPHVDRQRCLETIANRASAAKSVRHFGVRGLPWLEDEDARLLSTALRAMTRLQSLDIDLGAPPEHDLLHPDPPLSSDLEALNVADPWSAKCVCEGGARPIRIARIASPMDECTAWEVIPALGQSAGPLRQLQISLHLLSMADAIDVLSLLAHKLPYLHTLGVEIRTVKKVEEQDFERYAGQAGLALSALSELSTLSLVLPSHRRFGTLEDVRAISSKLPTLTHVELQWSGWSLTSSSWKESQSWQELMRRGWLYPHARQPVIRL